MVKVEYRGTKRAVVGDAVWLTGNVRIMDNNKAKQYKGLKGFKTTTIRKKKAVEEEPINTADADGAVSLTDEAEETIKMDSDKDPMMNINEEEEN